MNLERLSRVFAGIEPIGPIDYGACLSASLMPMG